MSVSEDAHGFGVGCWNSMDSVCDNDLSAGGLCLWGDLHDTGEWSDSEDLHDVGE